MTTEYICPHCNLAGERSKKRNLCIPCYKAERKEIVATYYANHRHTKTKKYQALQQVEKEVCSWNSAASMEYLRRPLIEMTA